jgi:multidrug efflux pump subunit AcrB
VHVEPASRTLVALGVAPGAILDAIGRISTVEPTGAVSEQGARLRVEAPEAESAEFAVRGLTIGAEGRSFNLADLAEIRRERVTEPSPLIRHNGAEAFTLGISGLRSENIVSVGERVEARLAEVASVLPVGVELSPIYEQHRAVAEANSEFLVSLAQSVGVVIGVLALFMGWRAAVVVGATLFLTVTFTFSTRSSSPQR